MKYKSNEKLGSLAMSAELESGESLLEAAEYMNKISGKQDMGNEKDSLNAET